MDTIKHLIAEREEAFEHADILKDKIEKAKSAGNSMESAIVKKLMKALSNYRTYGGNEINVGENEMAKLAYEMYDIVHEFLENILHYNWQGKESRIAIIGGIMINCDDDDTDMFVPLMFEVRSNKGKTVTDLFDEAYGPKESMAFPC